MQPELLVVVLLLIVGVGAALAWAARRRSSRETNEGNRGLPDVARGRRPPRPGQDRRWEIRSVDQQDATAVAELLPIEVAGAISGERLSLGTGAAAAVFGEFVDHANIQRLGSGEVLRLAGPPELLAGDLEHIRVKGKNHLVRGMFRSPENPDIAMHGEYQELDVSKVVSADLALSAVTFAVGMYWQKQLDDALEDLSRKVDKVIRKLDSQQLAKLKTAEESIAKIEAGLYDTGDLLHGRVDLPATWMSATEVYHEQMEWVEHALRVVEKLDKDSVKNKDVVEHLLGDFSREANMYIRSLIAVLHIAALEAALEARETDGGPSRYLEILEQQVQSRFEDFGAFMDLLERVRLLAPDRHRLPLPSHKKYNRRASEGFATASEMRELCDRLRRRLDPATEQPWELLLRRSDNDEIEGEIIYRDQHQLTS